MKKYQHKSPYQNHIKERLEIILQGLEQGKTLKQIGEGLDLKPSSVGAFLTKYWKPK